MKKAIFIKGKEYSDVKNIYNDGGEVEIKIKDRLGKASFELPIECIVYVPSTKDANAIIPKNEMQQRVKEVQKFLSNIFGGYSSANVDGGYVSSDKGLIQEDVVKVTAFATKDAIQKNMPKLVKRIQQWCNQWSQESIGFEFEGDLFYISATSKFMNGGKTKFGGGGTAEEQNRHMILSQAKEVAHHVKELNEILSKEPSIDSWVVAKMQDVTTGLSDITHYLDGKSEFRLGGENIQAVQDSMLANGAKLDVDRITMIPKNIIREIEESVKMGYNQVVVGMISPKTKGVMLVNDDYEVRGRYALGLKEAIEKIVYQKAADGVKLKSDNVNEFDLEGFSYEIYFRLENPDITIKKEKSGRYAIFNGILYIGSNPTLEAARQQAYYLHDKIKKRNTKYSNGAKLKSGKLTLSKIKDVLQQVNKQGYQLELKGALDDIRIVDVKSGKTTFEGSKEEVYNYLVQAKYISKFVDGGMDNFYSLQGMTNDEIIKFANELSFYDRMDEGIEEEFTEIEDAKDYLRLMEYEI